MNASRDAKLKEGKKLFKSERDMGVPAEERGTDIKEERVSPTKPMYVAEDSRRAIVKKEEQEAPPKPTPAKVQVDINVVKEESSAAKQRVKSMKPEVGQERCIVNEEHTPSKAERMTVNNPKRERAFTATDEEEMSKRIKVESNTPMKEETRTPNKQSARQIEQESRVIALKRSASNSATHIEARPHSHSSEMKIKTLESPVESKSKIKTSPSNTLRDRKLALHSAYSNMSPFPAHPHPTPTECALAHQVLVSLHGPRVRPKQNVAPTTSAGCGASESVLDALVRTVLSQNTSDANSTRAKLSMDAVYGRNDNWAAIVAGGPAKLEEAIRCGGLAKTKSKVILSILDQVHAKYETYSLDHLHTAPTETAQRELLSFAGVGPKTASCVLLFCLGRESFAVDTHVFRISGLLGWVPRGANRQQTQAHLEARVPDDLKYALHVLMVTHGRQCVECRAGGRSSGQCELRKAFGRRKEGDVKGEIDS